MEENYDSEIKLENIPSPFNYISEDGVSIRINLQKEKKSLSISVKQVEVSQYFFYKEFTYEDIIKIAPLFAIEEDIFSIDTLIRDSIIEYGAKISFKENEENSVYLTIKIKVNSKIRDVVLALDSTKELEQNENNEINTNNIHESPIYESIIKHVNDLLNERREIFPNILNMDKINRQLNEKSEKEGLQKNIEKIEKKLERMTKAFKALNENDLFFNSNIISKSDDIDLISETFKEIENENEEIQEKKKNNEYQFKNNIILKSVYKAIRDGGSAKEFHKRCDKIGPNITFIKTDKKIRFGGFTNCNWSPQEEEEEEKEEENNEDEKKEDETKKGDENKNDETKKDEENKEEEKKKEEKKEEEKDDDKDDDEDEGEDIIKKKDDGAFCFCLSSKTAYLHNNKKKSAIICSKDYGPTFAENIFSVKNNMLTNGGYCSKKKKSCFFGQNKNYEISGGQKNFKIKNLEVYEVIRF